jgi:hypothetical protein
MEIEWRGRVVKRCDDPEVYRPATPVEANDTCERWVDGN